MVLEPASIRSLLIRAWRERWSDIQWGIHIKTVLPRYISGDIYQLSDCLLQQALMGSLPNSLILSYLHHSLASQIVSFGGVIESISKYDGFSKPHCIQALLNLLHSMMKNVSCRGKAEDCMMLASSSVAGVKWLIQVMTITTEKLIDLQTAPELTSNLNLARSVLQEILESPFLMCMLHIGRREDPAMWSEVVKKISNLETLSVSATVIDDKDSILATVSEIKDKMPLRSIYGQLKYDSTKTPICHAVHSLIMLEVMKHTTRDAAIVTQQFLLLKKFKGLSLTELYLEVLRTCFIGMSCSEYKQYQELKWVGFTYIKVPAIIHSIHTSTYGEVNPGFSDELHTALQRLSSMVSLLDVADYRVNCNCLEYLFKELIPKTAAQPNQGNQTPSLDLISERDAQPILASRMQESNVLKNLQNTESLTSRPGNPDLILRAQPTVNSILKTLSNKNMDSVLTVLSLLISGKSRELLLIAAASSGNLHIYAQKFVKLNDQSREPLPGESTKMANSRALVFDISFLLLCHIAQVYGTETVVSENCETFVELWIQDNIPEPGKINVEISQPENFDVAVIEQFLAQIHCVDTETKYNQCNWGEICKLATLSIREVMCAAHHGQVIKQMIFDLLDRFCYHLCSLPICVAAWICAHIQQVDSEEAALAREFLLYMQSKMIFHDASKSTLDAYKDRSNLMCEIIGHMIQVMSGPPQYVSLSGRELSNSLDTTVPLSDLLNEVWNEIKNSSGLLSHKALAISQDVFRLGGAKWFVTNFVKSALDKVFDSDLNRAIDVIYGLFHLDIVNCTITHIVFTLPNYICGPASVDLMCEPRTSALGRLTAMLLVACWVAVQPSTSPIKTEANNIGSSSFVPSSPPGRGQKRPFSIREMEDLQERFNQHAGELPINIASLGLGPVGSFYLAAVHHMFMLMTQVTRTGVVSPVTHLIVFTLKELVSLPHSTTLLSLLPSSLLSNLLPLLSPPLSFNFPQLLALTAPEPSQEGTSPLPVDLLSHASGQDKRVCQAAAKLLCVKRNLELMS